MDATQNPLTTDEAMVIQMDAWERLERAESEVKLAGWLLDSLVVGAPLRWGVEATDRYRRAIAERDEAQAAFDAAQDIECPEEF